MTIKQRAIVHVDMDAFFASVEQRDRPSCKGRPVIVGSDPKKGKGRGVVAACSYEAREYGIRSAMPISIAYKKCPDAVFLPVDMSKYAQASHNVFDILENFTPDIEPISIDEAFMDITGSWHLFGTPAETCRKIKAAIKDQTRLTASVGLAPNKMTAKIASEIGKPDGLIIVSAKDLLDFLHPLPVGKLWGVGEKTLTALQKIGVNTIGDLARHSPERLEELFGASGRHIRELANGIDPRPVAPCDEVGSVSNEYTFDEDTRDGALLSDTLMYLSEKVSRRLRKEGLKGRTITLKIRSSDFRTCTRSVTIGEPTNYVDVIYSNVIERLHRSGLARTRVRLVGVKVSNLTDPSWRSDLFGNEGEDTRKERLHRALDRIVDRFGEGAVRRRT